MFKFSNTVYFWRYMIPLRSFDYHAVKYHAPGRGLWCLKPLSTTFHLHSDCYFYWCRKPEYPEKTTNLPQITDKIITCWIEYPLPWTGFELTILVVIIGTDCIHVGSCKSNYHTYDHDHLAMLMDNTSSKMNYTVISTYSAFIGHASRPAIKFVSKNFI